MGPLFEVNNKHVAAYGEPPSIDANTPHRHHSYFENAQVEDVPQHPIDRVFRERSFTPVPDRAKTFPVE